MKVKVKVKFIVEQAAMAQRRSRSIALLFLNSGLDGGWVVSATSRLLCARERDPVPTVKEAGWAPGPVWMGAENLVHIRIQSLD